MGKTKVFNPEEGYDLYADHYDKDSFYLDTFEKGEFYGMMGDIREKKVLELGAGTGRMTKMILMSGATVVALDVSTKMLDKIKKKYPKLEICKSDAQDIPFPDKTFDLITAAFVIVHLKNLDKIFEEVFRVLKKGGEFIFSNINQRKPPTLSDGKDKFLIKSFYHRPEDVRKELEACFFEIVDEKFIYEGKTWVNQIIKAKKS